MDRHHLKTIERLNLLLAEVFALAAGLLASPRFALGVAVGGVLAAANFSALRWLWDRVLAGSRRGGVALLLMIKMLGILVLVALALRLLPISAVGLAVGLSTFLLSIGIASVRFLIDPARGSST